MTIEQRVAVLEEIFSKLQDYYTSAYSGEEIDARLASAGVPVGITKEYKSVAEMNQDFTGTDVQRGQFVLILPDSTASADYGKVYLKGTANWVPAFTLTTLTSIKGPIGPPGKKGDKGDPGEAGSSFAILGYFDTLADLKAAVPNPKAGGVYGVGTAPPYNIYIWDSVHGKWVPNGNLQGPQGKQGIQGPEGKQGPDGKQGPPGPVGGSSNFVRYDAAQSLTDEQKAQARANIGADTVQGAVRYDAAQSLTDAQKTQARGNIGAAPGGFGLGGDAKVLTSNDDVNTIGASGWYTWVNNNVPINAIGVTSVTIMRVDAHNSGVKVQTLYGATDGVEFIMQPLVARRMIYGSKIGAWEWVNPPMQNGVEYRTTERFWGRPVYYKIVDCGMIADNKQVEHGIVNMRDCISFQGLRGGMPMPSIFNNNLSDPWSCYVADIGRTKITLACGTSAVGGNCHVMLKYTKTTD